MSSQSGAGDRRSRAAAWIAAVALLAVHAGLAIDTLRQESVTVDEVGHLPAGISYWQTGTFELYHHNPPLVKLLAAIPALATGPTVDYSKSWEANRRTGLPLNPWAFGWEFMYANAARYHDIYFYARLPVVGLSLVAGLVIFLWARELFGPVAGLTGVALWAFCPNAIAHAGLVTTDMGATSVGFVATFLFWRYLERPTWSWAVAAAVALGLAQLTKFSLLLLLVIWPALWLGRQAARWSTLRAASAAPSRHAVDLAGLSLSRGLAHLGALLALSVLVINVGYGFEGTFTRLGEYTFLSQSLTRPRQPGNWPRQVHPDHPWLPVLLERQNRFAGTWLARLPVPLPQHHVEGFDEQKLESEGVGGEGYQVYLCGQMRRTGWWWYYFFALAVKVPLGTWLLTLAAAFAALRYAPARARLAAELVLHVPPLVVLLVMSFLTDINLGLRYVLPVFPFWFVSVARLGRCIQTIDRRWLVLVLAALSLDVAACRFHPNHLAYFNELVGGPKRGGEYLIDSNLDWGQDLLQLQRWLRTNRPGERVGLAYFGNVDPSILAASGAGIDFYLAPPRDLGDLVLLAAGPSGRVTSLRERRLRELLAGRSAGQEELTREDIASTSPRALWKDAATRDEIARTLGLRAGRQPGLYAISANFVHGLQFRLRDQEGNLWDAQPDAYAYFQHETPIATAGYSILIFEIKADGAAAK